MTGIELYINQQLCDIDSVQKFSVHLKRQLLNPSEMGVKDAQRSYSITLPASPTNNAIFGHINVEEVNGKFGQLYDATLSVGGEQIFEGKFRLSEVSRKAYKGNLGVPAPKSVKEVFGDLTLGMCGSWPIRFDDKHNITAYNTKADAECIFPLVLYGLLPTYLNIFRRYPRNRLDENVTKQMKINDFQPSVNCVQMLQNIFKNAGGYQLTGTALHDERINKLYVSYKNENAYEPPSVYYNTTIKGTWHNWLTGIKEDSSAAKISADGGVIYAADLFNKEFSTDLVTAGSSNIVYHDNDNRFAIKVPVSGLYKISFSATIGSMVKSKTVPYVPYNKHKIVYSQYKYTIPADGWASPAKTVTTGLNAFNTKKFEVKVIRKFKDQEWKLEDVKMDNRYDQYHVDPQQWLYPEPGCVNFVDTKQNANLLCGLAFGKDAKTIENNPFDNPYEYRTVIHNPMAIKNGISWGSGNYSAHSATASPYYRNTDKYRVDLADAPQTASFATDSGEKAFMEGNGMVHQIVWLEKDEEITIVGVSDECRGLIRHPTTDDHFDIDGWLRHSMSYELSVEPFRYDREWLSMDDEGSSYATMDWNDNKTIKNDEIDLIKFLPADTKVDSWINNFCKIFNLTLTDLGDKKFSLDIRNAKLVSNTSTLIDLDSKSSVQHTSNEPLNLPASYELKFKIDSNEEGFYESMKNETHPTTNQLGNKMVTSGDTGGGIYYTNSLDSNALVHSSDFSYNWYKQLYDKNKKELVKVPVITEHSIWDSASKYEDVYNNKFYNLTQRFWYKQDERLPMKIQNRLGRIVNIEAALVSNTYNKTPKLVLNYGDEPHSLKNSFFTLLTNDRDYTMVECFLSPGEYNSIDTALFKFNGSIYNVVEVNGYDPTGMKKCKIKLIPKIG